MSFWDFMAFDEGVFLHLLSTTEAHRLSTKRGAGCESVNSRAQLTLFVFQFSGADRYRRSGIRSTARSAPCDYCADSGIY
jgi:hypothetical protein